MKILYFFYFLGHFCPPGSGSAIWMRIRIQQLKLMRIHADPDPEPWLPVLKASVPGPVVMKKFLIPLQESYRYPLGINPISKCYVLPYLQWCLRRFLLVIKNWIKCQTNLGRASSHAHEKTHGRETFPVSINTVQEFGYIILLRFGVFDLDPTFLRGYSERWILPYLCLHVIVSNSS